MIKTKAPKVEELQELPGFPSSRRLKKGIVAVIECEQEIPCNPCEDICPAKAISIGDPITNLPILNDELCTGCGLCIAGCPGQAIFVVDETYSETEDLVGIPYEFFPVPATGDLVRVADRDGQDLGEGRVIKIFNSKKNDKTIVVYIAVRKDLGKEVRALVRG